MWRLAVPRRQARALAAWRASWALLVFLAAAGAAARDLPPFEDSLAQRLKACSACHGPQGRATNQGYFPRIAGKPAGYLYNQLVNFREGRRRHEAMTYLIDHMSDAYLREIADHFAGLNLPYPAPQTQTAARTALERGEQLVRHGDPARGIPACSTCHGTNMTGIAPAMPGLLGLPRDYLLGQFGGWRNGERRAVAPDCMKEIAQRLSADDVGAMADWLSSQPITAGAAPPSMLPKTAPMPCGSGWR